MTLQLKKSIMKRSREQKLEHFYSLCPQTSKVLDVGVFGEKRMSNPVLNYFLKTFRYPSQNYTGLSIRDLSQMDRLFPGKRFVQYSGGTFPFGDKEFDWVFSNAVIEHVGTDAAQLKFVNEMLRVARNVFFTTPYKYFPIETHTNMLLLHWNDRWFFHWCAKNRGRLNRNLNLLSGGQLKSIMNRSDAADYRIRKNRILGLTMTFTVVCSQ